MRRPIRSILGRIKENARLTMDSLKATWEADKAMGAKIKQQNIEDDARDKAKHLERLNNNQGDM